MKKQQRRKGLAEKRVESASRKEKDYFLLTAREVEKEDRSKLQCIDNG